MVVVKVHNQLHLPQELRILAVAVAVVVRLVVQALLLFVTLERNVVMVAQLLHLAVTQSILSLHLALIQPNK